MNLYTIFKCAQLLETFPALPRHPFPLGKPEQRVAPETINALMAKHQGVVGPGSTTLLFGGPFRPVGKGNRFAKEVDRCSGRIDRHLYLMRRGSLGGIRKRMSRGHYFNPAIRPK